MSTGMTFTSLQGDLQAYLERGYVTDATVFRQLPRLINLAERAIARAIKLQGFIIPVLSTLQAGVNVYVKPDRWRRTVYMNFGAAPTLFLLATEEGIPLGTEDDIPISLETVITTLNNRTPIYPRSLEYCRQYWPDSTLQDPPEFYADYDYQHWLVVPTPDISYPWEVIYYQLPPLLDVGNQTNWLTQYAPNALLYRTLLEMTPFLKDDARVGVWKDFYQEEMSNLNAEDLQKVVDRDAVRNEA